MFQAMTLRFRTYFLSRPSFGLILILFASVNISIGNVQTKVQGLFSLPLMTKRQSVAGHSPQEVTALEFGKAVERELIGGHKHSYQLTLAEGQYASVIVEQRGIDVLVRVLGADGKPFAVFDTERWNQGKEAVELVAETGGGYRLVVEAKSPKAITGGYEIRLAELRPATAKNRALQQARGLLAECNRLRLAGKYDSALLLGEQLLEIRQRELGLEHRDVAVALNHLAILYRAKDDHVKAESLHRRALAILEKVLGPEHPEVGVAFNNLGLVFHFQKGDYVNAELLYQRALAIWEKTLESDHLYLPAVLNNIAILYVARGDFVKAEPLYRRALAIQERVQGPEDLGVARSLNNLAELYRQQGEFDKAEPLYQRSLTIYEKALGPEHPDVSDVLGNLAIVYRHKGDYAKAESLHRRALVIREKELGPEHSAVADSLNNIAVIYYEKGDYLKAEPLYRRALAIQEKTLGPNHPDIIVILNNLSALHALTGGRAESVAYLSRYLAVGEYNLDINLATGSERQKLAYLATLSAQSDWVITLHLRFAPEQPQACDLAATTIIQRKGRVQDAIADSFAALRRRSSAADQAVLDRLGDTTARLAQVVLNGPQQASLAEHQRQIKGLEEEREKLDAEINRRSAGYYERPQAVGLAAVRAALPANAALIEFAVYRPFDPKTETYDETHYVAYIVRKQGDVQWVNLGEAKTIDAAIDKLRQALRDPKRKDIEQLARVVDEKIMQPVRALAGGATHLLISPDGALNLIPFEALVDEQGKYLLERYSFTYLTSGRDLLRMQVARESKSPPLVLADPLFGEPLIAQVAKAEAPKAKPIALRRKRQSVTTGTDLSNVYFAPLGGTAGEARVIKSLFAEANVLTGTQATEAAIKQINVPRILHIATHGFFLQDAAPAETSKDKKRSISASAKIENPLLRSGLARAGANLRNEGGDDGILTALEASGLNLWGTKLVTLSACDTGIGEVKDGEGVYGLRRAFVLAGAESLVMSLWPVSDYVTREMMTAYYRGLRQGLGRGEALRQVQLALLKRKERQHPFYWASFIQAGEWANLEGKR